MVERRIGKLRINEKFSAARVQRSFTVCIFVDEQFRSTITAKKVRRSTRCVCSMPLGSSEGKLLENGTVASAKYRRIKIEYQFRE
jgi:hypothetical protein